MKLRHVTLNNLDNIATAWALIAEGRGKLRRAGARKAANATARALKSVDGALRHAQRCYHAETGINFNPIREEATH